MVPLVAASMAVRGSTEYIFLLDSFEKNCLNKDFRIQILSTIFYFARVSYICVLDNSDRIGIQFEPIRAIYTKSQSIKMLQTVDNYIMKYDFPAQFDT